MNSQLIIILFVTLFVSFITSQSIQNFGLNPNQSQPVIEPSISASNATVSESKTKRTCACDETATETPVCASNGVTYKTSCRFDCAKARVTRLRVIRKGPCSQTTGTGSYWQNKGFKG